MLGRKSCVVLKGNCSSNISRVDRKFTLCDGFEGSKGKHDRYEEDTYVWENHDSVDNSTMNPMRIS